MSCAHSFAVVPGGEAAFTVDASRITFGRGCIAELGARTRALGVRRVALFTDPRVAALEPFARGRASLREAGLDVVVYDAVVVEPTDASFHDAARFAAEARVDGYVSIGGGSVIDTCKAANLHATHPAEPLAYVNAPVGEARPIPGPLAPHVACPTTSGTGSEVTGIAIFDLVARGLKTGIASPLLRPTEALIDPDFTRSLPGGVVAASGMDVLCHALESYTARPFTSRVRPAAPLARPMSQGANRWSDVGCVEALSIFGRSFARAVADANDDEAREDVMWAATLAGIAFGNSGVHVPHAMSYAVAGLAKTWHAEGYDPKKPMVPHGISVVVNAPAVFRHTASACPERHLDAARALGADVRGATPADAGEILARTLTAWMKDVRLPNGIGGVGYAAKDVPALTERALPQQRLLANAPCTITEPVLDALFRAALAYW
jgi:alcohol dehydrogenase class IV